MSPRPRDQVLLEYAAGRSMDEGIGLPDFATASSSSCGLVNHFLGFCLIGQLLPPADRRRNHLSPYLAISALVPYPVSL